MLVPNQSSNLRLTPSKTMLMTCDRAKSKLQIKKTKNFKLQTKKLNLNYGVTKAITKGTV